MDYVTNDCKKWCRMVFRSGVVLMAAAIIGLGSEGTSLALDAAGRVPELIEQAKRATVGVLKGDGFEEQKDDFGVPVSIRGTGIHIGQGLILTVRHAVERVQGGKHVVPEVIQVLTDDLRELPAVRKGASAFLDVALYQLSVGESEWPPSSVPLAEDPATYGDAVFTVGYPLGWGPAISYGIVGNPNTFLPTVQSRLIQVDMSVCRGNSGGGVMNHQGRLVGLVHAIIQTEMEQEDRRCSRFAFALPGLLVKRVATALIDGQTPSFSLLGLHLDMVSHEGRRALRITKVSGPSRHAGFRKGDLVVGINGVPIHSSAQLKNYLIEQTEPGETVAVLVLRDEQPQEIPVVLGGS
jgi:serine protease Do